MLPPNVYLRWIYMWKKRFVGFCKDLTKQEGKKWLFVCSRSRTCCFTPSIEGFSTTRASATTGLWCVLLCINLSGFHQKGKKKAVYFLFITNLWMYKAGTVFVDLCTKPTRKALWAVCTAHKKACIYGKQYNCQYMINHSFITITLNNEFEWNHSSLLQ